MDSIPLLKRVREEGFERWAPRAAGDISEELGEHYGLPIDVASKAAGLVALARALNENRVAHAQFLAPHLEFPSAPLLMKRGVAREDVIRFIRELYWSGLIKADWDPDEHPRWPAGAPDSQGGQFAPKGEGGDDDDSATADGDASGGELLDVAAKLSARDRAYLDNYYGPVSALAQKYGVDPALVLGVGIESGFAS